MYILLESKLIPPILPLLATILPFKNILLEYNPKPLSEPPKSLSVIPSSLPNLTLGVEPVQSEYESISDFISIKGELLSSDVKYIIPCLDESLVLPILTKSSPADGEVVLLNPPFSTLTVLPLMSQD